MEGLEKQSPMWAEDNGSWKSTTMMHDYSRFGQEDNLSSSTGRGHEQLFSSDYRAFDALPIVDVASPLLQTSLDEISKLIQIQPQSGKKTDLQQSRGFPATSFELLNKHANGIKRLNLDRLIEPVFSNRIAADHESLSTEEIMWIAGAKFIHYSCSYSKKMNQDRHHDLQSMLNHPYDSSFSTLCHEDSAQVELAQLLLSSEKVAAQQYERASKLLDQCDQLCSDSGNPVQRVVFYFSEALREKVDRETGGITPKGLGNKIKLSAKIQELILKTTTTAVSCHEALPFSQIAQFAGIQALVENIGDASKIHVIDLNIRCGVHWTVLFQALASRRDLDDSCPLRSFKITAVGTSSSKREIEETGKRLSNFVQSQRINHNFPLIISFSYKAIIVAESLSDLKETDFELDDEEKVAVLSEYLLMDMILVPEKLETLMRVIKGIKTSVMVVNETEANHNSPSFSNRFIEALFFYSSFFDCLDACMKRNDPNRKIAESLYFGLAIRNIVATEGADRKVRHVKIDVWRQFFERFGLVEMELSPSLLFQAKLLLQRFPSDVAVPSQAFASAIPFRRCFLHSARAFFSWQIAHYFMERHSHSLSLCLEVS